MLLEVTDFSTAEITSSIYSLLTMLYFFNQWMKILWWIYLGGLPDIHTRASRPEGENKMEKLEGWQKNMNMFPGFLEIRLGLKQPALRLDKGDTSVQLCQV